MTLRERCGDGRVRLALQARADEVEARRQVLHLARERLVVGPQRTQLSEERVAVGRRSGAASGAAEKQRDERRGGVSREGCQSSENSRDREPPVKEGAPRLDAVDVRAPLRRRAVDAITARVR